MSRHILGIATGHLVMGWDPPLQTFFLQVHDRGAEHARVILGGSVNALPTVDALFRVAAPYMVGTVWERGVGDLRARLYDEQDRNVA
ncbi:hypothetical protein DMC47_10395 [Nostoc sp. 3335mG]|nr:hypothetical protein DMC47_10395 [Nostoc sp. 3335mG]